MILKKEIKIWWMYSINAFQQVLMNRYLISIFLFGKILRIFVFLLFIYYLLGGSRTMVGYTREQVIFFYLTFNLVDTLAQFFFREVYRFRGLLMQGGFDFVLLKPLNPLVRVLMGGADLMDMIILVILIIAVGWYGTINISSNPVDWLLYIGLIINSFLIAAAFHMIALGIGIMVLTVDHLVMIFRDLSGMLRIPVDLYSTPIRFLLTFILPLGIMFTVPAKALMGILSIELLLISFGIGVLSIFLAVKFWQFSIRFYQSASS